MSCVTLGFTGFKSIGFVYFLRNKNDRHDFRVRTLHACMHFESRTSRKEYGLILRVRQPFQAVQNQLGGRANAV